MKALIQKDKESKIKTMTAAQIIETLKKVPPNTPVLATYEGVYSSFLEGEFRTEGFSNEGKTSPISYLVINVEYE